MVRAILAVLSLAVPVVAAVPADRFITPEVQEGLRQIKAAFPRWTSVNLRVYSGSGTFFDVTESFLRINLNGSKDASKNFRFSGMVDDEFLNVTLSPLPKGGFNAWGFGVNLSVTPSGDGYRLWGNVDSRNVNLSLNRFGDGFSIWGQGGVNLNASKFGRDLTVSGSLDLNQFGKKPLAVLGTVLAAVSAPKPAQ